MLALVSCKFCRGLDGSALSLGAAADLFRQRLDEQINLMHPLVRLAGLIDWAEIHRSFAVRFLSDRGRPALPPRLVGGLLYLQHALDASDAAW